MRTDRLLGLAAMIVLGLTVEHASAQDAKARRPQLDIQGTLLKLDVNNDFVLDPSEVPEKGKAAFGRLLELGDRNGDGKLEREEIEGLLQEMRNALPQGRPSPERFMAFDKDGDGKVSAEEFAGPQPLFQRLDADKDGFVTKSELANLPPAPGVGPRPNAMPVPERFKQADANNDGALSRDEFPGAPAAFDRIDADKDGRITAEEARKAREAGVGPGPGAPPKPEAKPAETPAKSKGEPETSGPMARLLMQRADKNADGRLSRDEFPGREQLFDRLDADKDGQLTPEELARGRAALERIQGKAKAKTEKPN